ncbi:hypothetical protein D3C74_180880 [compost metagenome]
MLYSRRTVVETLKLLGEKNHSDINEMAFTHDIDDKYTMGQNRKERIMNLTKYLLSIQENQEDTVNEIVETLIMELLKRSKFNFEYHDECIPIDVSNPTLFRALRIDGFTIRDFELIRQLPESIKLHNQQDELFMLLEKHKFDTSRGHLEQALDNHAQGKWASSNAQIRTFMESLFDTMADKIFGEDNSGSSSTGKRDKLGKTNPPLLSSNLNEIGNDGKNFSNGLMKRLHPEGSHAGLSDMEDCTFRVHLIVVVASHYLRKYDQGILPI